MVKMRIHRSHGFRRDAITRHISPWILPPPTLHPILYISYITSFSTALSRTSSKKLTPFSISSAKPTFIFHFTWCYLHFYQCNQPLSPSKALYPTLCHSFPTYLSALSISSHPVYLIQVLPLPLDINLALLQSQAITSFSALPPLFIFHVYPVL